MVAPAKLQPEVLEATSSTELQSATNEVVLLLLEADSIASQVLLQLEVDGTAYQVLVLPEA